jgi:hypothetical protein
MKIKKFIIIINIIITKEIIFRTFMKFFKKDQLTITKHNIDIIRAINSNINNKIDIIVNDIEFKQLLLSPFLFSFPYIIINKYLIYV